MPWKRLNTTNRGKFIHNRSLIYTCKLTNCPTTASSVTQVSVLLGCHNSATPLYLVFWFLSGSLLEEGFLGGHAPKEEGKACHTTTQTVVEMPNLYGTSPTTMLELQEPILSTSNGQPGTRTSVSQQPETWGRCLTDQAIKDSLWSSLLLHILGKVEEYLNIFRAK